MAVEIFIESTVTVYRDPQACAGSGPALMAPHRRRNQACHPNHRIKRDLLGSCRGT